jgi:hypothetical protein
VAELLILLALLSSPNMVDVATDRSSLQSGKPHRGDGSSEPRTCFTFGNKDTVAVLSSIDREAAEVCDQCRQGRLRSVAQFAASIGIPRTGECRFGNASAINLRLET